MQFYPSILALALCGGASCSALAMDAPYVGSVETIQDDRGSSSEAKGYVFIDLNRNSKMDSDEQGLEGVSVSNGREVVFTDTDGFYILPAYDDMNLFVTKPSGYLTPVNAQMVPQFSYIHKEAGSPPLRYGGIAPTGQLPETINFPLIKHGQDSSFDCLIFGDPQTYSNRELGYVRDTAGQMLASLDSSETECLIFTGDIMGDDLSLFPRFKEIISIGQVPMYFVGGNHDLDFDATDDADSFDTFRREWGPEYYSFNIGDVHFVALDNVRYPCNGIDPHPFCASDAKTDYNGIISDRQLDWLKNDLEFVPHDKLIVLIAHIPFVSFTQRDSAKGQTDNLKELYDIVGDRPTLGLAGHTHTVENIEPGEHYEGWSKHTGTGPAAFHQIITGGLSASWWAGDLNDQGVPHSIQRLGAPRGYFQIEFEGSDYIETYKTFHTTPETQMHASLNTPRFRAWAEQLLAYRDQFTNVFDDLPPVIRRELGDTNLLTLEDLARDTWVAVNVWNGSRSSIVSAKLNGGPVLQGSRTQLGTGERSLHGVEYADPYALVRQATQSSLAAISSTGGKQTQGYRTFRGAHWRGKPGPLLRNMLADASQHLWRIDLPKVLPLGLHRLDIETTDRHGRTFSSVLVFEVVNALPMSEWNNSAWE